MILSELKFLADENIHPEVIAFLNLENYDFTSVFESNLNATSDELIIDSTQLSKRVIITHDSDFGKIVFTGKKQFSGIIYLRPGHIKPEFTISTFKEIIFSNLDYLLPFIWWQRTMVMK